MSGVVLFLKSKIFYFLLIGFAASVAIVTVVTVSVVDKPSGKD